MQNFTICHWDLHSIAAHNFIKVALFKACLSVHNMNIVCLPKTYLDSAVRNDDNNLQIPGYSSVRADHPTNAKRSVVLVYYKSYLSLKLIDVKYLHECINFELRIAGKIVKFLYLYTSCSRNRYQLEIFLEHLELNFDHMAETKPYIMVVVSDFNVKLNSWYANDSPNIEGSKFYILTSSYGFNKIIKEPTHIVNNSSSWIDLIFTSQSNLVTESGLTSSLHSNFHY